MSSIKSAIAETAKRLGAAGVDQPQTEANTLLADLLGRDRSFLVAHSENELSPGQLSEFDSRVARRAAGEPLQYIVGHQEFFRLDFEVTPDVLIPRPETELIVEAALVLVKHGISYFGDIGTGSGCVAISILNELPGTKALAVDISAAALRVARRNAERHGVIDRLGLVESDGLGAIDPGETFNFIVSNPPYVSDREMKTLQREVQHEPANALAGGPDGLTVIRRLLQATPAHLKAGGHFIFEIGFAQAETVKELIDQKIWELIDIKRDLADIPRTVILRKK
jgi:release factor glutamine methyltransferase